MKSRFLRVLALLPAFGLAGLLSPSSLPGRASEAQVRPLSSGQNPGLFGVALADSGSIPSWALAFPKFTDPSTRKVYRGDIDMTGMIRPIEGDRFLVVANVSDVESPNGRPTHGLIMVLGAAGGHGESMVLYDGEVDLNMRLYAAAPTRDGGAIVVGQLNQHALAMKVSLPPPGGGYDLLEPNRHRFRSGAGPIRGIEWIRMFDFGARKPQNTGETRAVIELRDGGFVLAGDSTVSSWIVKLDPAGNVLWIRNPGYFPTSAQTLRATPDGGFITLCRGLTKFDSEGRVEWQAAYHEPECREPCPSSLGPRVTYDNYGTGPLSVAVTNDGGYILSGGTWCGPCSQSSYWILRVDSSGNILWQKAYEHDATRGDIIPTRDGGFLALRDEFLIKLDSSGADEWVRQVNADDTLPTLVAQASDGGYVLGFDSGDTMNILRLDSNGNIGSDCPLVGPGLVNKSISALNRVAPGEVSFTPMDFWIETPPVSVQAMTSQATLSCGSRSVGSISERDQKR